MAEGNIKIDAAEMDKLVEIFDGCTHETFNAGNLIFELLGDLNNLYKGKADQSVNETWAGLYSWMIKMNLIYYALSTFITNTHAQFSNVDSTKGEHADSAIETEETTKEN